MACVYIPTIDDCFNSYHFCRSIINEKKLATLNAISSMPLTRLPKDIESKFAGKTKAEIAQIFELELIEHEYLHIVKIVAAAEAFIIMNANSILNDKKEKSEIKQEIKKIRRRCRLDVEQLINMWKNYKHGQARVFSEHLRIRKDRHWLAHGRYWDFMQGRIHSMPEVYTNCSMIVSIIEEHN